MEKPSYLQSVMLGGAMMQISLTESDPRPAESEAIAAAFHYATTELITNVKTMRPHDKLWVFENINRILDAMEK